MKIENAKKRLENRYKGSKNAIAYKLVKEVIENQKAIIRPCWTSGRGRFTTNLDYTKDTENLLVLLGIKFESGNDYPLGGKPGNYIKILTKIV